MRNYRAFRGAAFTLGVATLAVVTVAGAQPAAPPPPPAPSAPPASAPSAASPAPSAPAAPAAPRAPQSAAGLANAADVRQGVVRLERGGRTIGMGAVLRSDGRILTALSALGHGNYIDARFADGSLLRVRAVHTDRGWDLALLVTDGGHWTQGLRPSVLERPASGSTLHRFRARGGRLEESTSSLSAAQTLLGRDGVSLRDALVLSSRMSDDELGTPLFDERGEVAAVVVQACAPSGPDNCQLGTFGAPVSALKQFLRQAPPREPLPAAWLGLRSIAAHDGAVAGVRVLSVEPNGPAARAGLRGEAATRGGRESNADLIVAVQDAPVTTPEEMRDAVNRFALSPPNEPAAARDSDGATEAGERRVRLLVFGSGKFREVLLPLRAPRQLPETAPPTPAPRAGAASARPPAASQPPAGSRESAPGADSPAASKAVTAPSAPTDKSKSSIEAN